MQSQDQNRPIADDEIDLEIVRFSVQRQMQAIRNGLVGLKEKRRKIALCMAGGVVLGIAAFYMLPPKYEADMTLTNGGLPTEILYQRLNRLNQFIDDDEYETVASLLKTSREFAASIDEISYLNFNQKLDPEDSLNEAFFFLVRVRSGKKAVFKQLQPLIIGYLESGPFLQKERQIRINTLNSQIGNLEKTLKEVDSLKKIIAASLIPRANSQGIIYGEPPDQVNVIRKGIELYDNRLHLKSELQRMNIEIVNEFVTGNKPVFPKLSRLLAAGLLLGFIIALMLPASRRREAS